MTQCCIGEVFIEVGNTGILEGHVWRENGAYKMVDFGTVRRDSSLKRYEIFYGKGCSF